jgi:hypothetical protein
LSDLALGIIVLVFAAVPASLLLLALADGVRLEGEGRKRRWIRNCLWALALPASVPLGLGAWSAAGAAHLEPLCHAYATPEFRALRAATDPVLRLDLPPGAATPAWVAELKARFPGRVILATDNTPVARSTHVLEVREVTHHRNLWFTVQMTRFRLLESDFGSVLAEGDELQIEAGRGRHHCGIGSGPLPVAASRTSWPGGDGVARFVERGLQPAPLRP